MRFINNIFNAVYNNLISGGAYYLIAKGVIVTAFVAVLAWIVSAALGVLVSYLMCYEKKVVSVIGRCFCFLFRSVPVILIMWLFYYCIFGSSHMNSAVIAGLAIGLWGAGHLSEILARSAKKEQKRLSENVQEKLERVYFSVVVPQAAEDALFDIKRLCVHVFQWTAVAGYISVNDLTEVMYGIGHRTMYPFFSIFFTAVCYMIVTLIIEWIFSLIEKKLKKNAEEQQ